jgi:predicted negative regulator of RcsB-dependent stress response
MATHLDLEEQEKLDELKHFWNTYGNLISWVLIVVFGGFAAYNGWQYWQRTQAVQASVLYDEAERAAQAGGVARLERSFADIKDKYPRTVYAQQAGLVAAQALVDRGNLDGAKAALAWVAEHASDPGYQAVARLRQASLLVEAKAYDEALKQLNGEFPSTYQALVADRKGDVLNLQGKKAEAKEEYTKAYRGMDPRSEYRRLLEVKLTALGVDAKTLVADAAPATEGAKP